MRDRAIEAVAIALTRAGVGGPNYELYVTLRPSASSDSG